MDAVGRLGGTIVVLLTMPLPGCGGDEEGELAIRMNQAPTSACELSPEGGGARIASGVFDLVIGDVSSYILTPLVANNGGEDITVTTARLEAYEERDGASYRLNFACHLPSGCDEWDIDLCGTGGCPVVPAGGTASFEVQALPRVVTGYYQLMLDAAVREGRRPSEHDIRSVVRLVGTAGSRDVISDPFEWVTHLCLGCLVEFPPGSDDPAIVGEDCCGLGTPESSCYPSQDDPIDCRLCVRTSPEVCNFGRTSCGF